ncbi:MAG: MogA/MoaB family molybdenum cofactor biosynthesis protein [Planctomycetota bacterium]
MSVEQHKAAAAGIRVAAHVVTISDTRTPADDRGGDLLTELLTDAGIDVAARSIIPDDHARIIETLHAGVADPDIDAVICTGGTGVSPRDVTPDALAEIVEKPMPAFAALFAQLSHAEVGSAALLSRAAAGTARSTFLAALPGSPAAVRLAVDALLAPELAHIVDHLRRKPRPG